MNVVNFYLGIYRSKRKERIGFIALLNSERIHLGQVPAPLLMVRMRVGVGIYFLIGKTLVFFQ